MRTQVCFEHHVHDESCFSDLDEQDRKHRAWCKAQCEVGWPAPSGYKQHAVIKIDDTWLYCPLCGRRIR